MVRVPFGGKKLITGIVFAIHNIPPDLKNLKRITEVLNSVPVINQKQLKLWEWISDYYLCTEGEVMKAAMPSGVSLESYKPRVETFIKLTGKYTDKELNMILDNLEKAGQHLGCREILFDFLFAEGVTLFLELFADVGVIPGLRLLDAHALGGEGAQVCNVFSAIRPGAMCKVS